MNALTIPITIRLSVCPFKPVSFVLCVLGISVVRCIYVSSIYEFQMVFLLKFFFVINTSSVCVWERDKETETDSEHVHTTSGKNSGQKTTFWSWLFLFSVGSRIKVKSSDSFSKHCYPVSLHSDLRLTYNYIMPFSIPSNKVWLAFYFIWWSRFLAFF